MSRKAIIVFVLSAGILAAALVFDGVSHRRMANNGQTTSQNSVATQPTSQPADASNGSTNPQTDAQAAGTQSEAQADNQPAVAADANAGLRTLDKTQRRMTLRKRKLTRMHPLQMRHKRRHNQSLFPREPR